MRGSAIISCVLAAFLSWAAETLGQGTFQNLDFESPIPPLVPDIVGMVPITNALPGWRGFIGDTEVTLVWYNSRPLGDAGISLYGPDSSEEPSYHGAYNVYLAGGIDPRTGELIIAAISQVGQIPPDARSLTFYVRNISLMQVSFGGQTLPVSNLGGPRFGWQQWGVDVSSFAGQTGELRFTGGVGNFDYIQFSTSVIPEPSMGAFILWGAAAWGLIRWRLNRRT